MKLQVGRLEIEVIGKGANIVLSPDGTKLTITTPEPEVIEKVVEKIRVVEAPASHAPFLSWGGTSVTQPTAPPTVTWTWGDGYNGSIFGGPGITK